MDWMKWNDKMRKLEKKKRRMKKYTTNLYGNVLFEFKSRRRKNGKKY